MLLSEIGLQTARARDPESQNREEEGGGNWCFTDATCREEQRAQDET